MPTDPAVLTPDAIAEARVPAPDYRYTAIDVPDASWTQAYRINARGVIVGTFQDPDGLHGFVLRRGSLETIDVVGAVGVFTQLELPGAVMSGGWEINARGTVVGHYIPSGHPRCTDSWRAKADSRSYGFVAEPLNPNGR
jgi:uncharacterized membrane protein